MSTITFTPAGATSTPITLEEAWRGCARGTDIPPPVPYFTNHGGSPIRQRPRRLAGAAADAMGNETPGADVSWLTTQLDHYLERAYEVVVSPNGGITQTLATRTSDKYDGHPVHTPGASVALGDRCGWMGCLYEADAAGVCGASSPTHTTGTVSDGGVPWRFIQRQMRTSITSAIILNNDGKRDGMLSWPTYMEQNQYEGAGSNYSEHVNRNASGHSVVNDPYNPTPSRSSISWVYNSGGDPVYGPAATHPSTCGLVFDKLVSQPWHSAIVFADGAFADQGGGVYLPVKLARKHRLRWYAGAGITGADIYSDVSTNTERVALAFMNRIIQFQCQAGRMGTFESAAPAGQAPENYLGIVAQPASTGHVQLVARTNTGASDCDILLTPLGAGKVRFGTYVADATITPTGYTMMKDAAGNLRKVLLA